MLPGMTYTWRVCATNKATTVDAADASWSAWSDDWTFTTRPPSAASTISAEPSSGTTVNALAPSLRWSDNQAFIFYYEIQLSKDQTFNTNPTTATAAVYSNLVHGGQSQPLNSWRVPTSFPLELGVQYYWRVRPRVQGSGAPVNRSLVFSFKTGAPFGVTFAPILPASPLTAEYVAGTMKAASELGAESLRWNIPWQATEIS